MKNRNIDCRAVSYTDRICFYVNSMQYYEAIDNGDEIEVHLKDDEKNEETEQKFFKVELKSEKKSTDTPNNKEKKSYFKKVKDILITNKKDFLIVLGVIYSILISCYIMMSFFKEALNLGLSIAFILSILFHVIDLTYKMCNEILIDEDLKSKHGAEHSMINFMIKHDRLPKTLTEVRTASRFSLDCGSRNEIKGRAERYLATLSSLIVSIILQKLIEQKLDNIIAIVILFVSFILLEIIFVKIIRKKNLLYPVTKWIEDQLTMLLQVFNTRGTTDHNILVAYCVAIAWFENFIKTNENE